jgi:hypothetical protein
VTFAFIATEKATEPPVPIASSCKLFGVSTSGSYDWSRPNPTRANDAW